MCRGRPQQRLDSGAEPSGWQLNEILGLIFPATNGIGVMNEDLWDQTVAIATEQIAELQGVEIPDDVYRTDLAQAAVDALGDARRHRFELRETRDRAARGRQLDDFVALQRRS